MKTWMKVFNVQILPIVTYGLHLFYDRLKAITIQLLDSVKSRFLRKAMQLPPTAPTERTHYVANQERLHKDLILKNYQFKEDAVRKHPNNVEKPAQTIPLVDPLWLEARQPRHFLVGYAVYGFHHLICDNKKYHKILVECSCKYCDNPITDYLHFDECPALNGSRYEKSSFCTI